MRKTLCVLSVAAAAALSTPAFAQPVSSYYHPGYVAPLAGVAVGTVVGVGLHNSWFGSTASSTWPSTAAGAATAGFVAGVGTVALIHAATTPCQGFQALFGGLLTSSEGCVNGQYVGYAGEPRRYR